MFNPHIKKIIIILQCVVFLSGCTGLEKSSIEKLKERNATGEYVYRHHDEVAYPIPSPKPRTQEKYPWQEK